jgi:hypothetical protein
MAKGARTQQRGGAFGGCARHRKHTQESRGAYRGQRRGGIVGEIRTHKQCPNAMWWNKRAHMCAPMMRDAYKGIHKSWEEGIYMAYPPHLKSSSLFLLWLLA